MTDLNEHYKKIIEELVPRGQRTCLLKIVKKAYEKTAILYGSDVGQGLSKDNPVGDDVWADIVRAHLTAAALELGSQCGFGCRTKKNKSGNCSHLEMDNGRVLVVFALAASRNDVGKDSIYRQNLIRPLMGSLFEKDTKVAKDKINVLLVTYGPVANKHMMPEFINIGIPGEKGWLGRLPLVEETMEPEEKLVTLVGEDNGRNEKTGSAEK